MAKEKMKTITAEDLYRFEYINDMRISPDGDHVVYQKQRVEKKTEKKYSNLWIVPTKGGVPHQFTYGNQSDYHPRWSPDGKSIAFISNRHDESNPQIYVIPFNGGEAKKLTDLKGTIGSFIFTPDSRQLILNFRMKDKEELDREKDEQKKKLGVVARHYTNLFFKLDGEGFLTNEKWHLWSVDFKTGKAKQLTEGEKYDEWSASISPDGKTLAFCSNRSANPELNPDEIDIFLMPTKGGKMTKIKTPFGPKGQPSFSPCGKWIAYYGSTGEAEWYKNQRLWLIASDGKTPSKCLTEKYDFNVSNWTINDLGGANEMMPPTWMPDGSSIGFPVAHHGVTVLKRINLKSGELEDAVAQDGVVGTFTPDTERTKLAFFFSDMKNPGQIYVKDNLKKTIKKLTTDNESWLNKLDLGEVEEKWFKGGDGKVDLQGWIIKPPGFNPKHKYPAILEIHGGPRVQYGKSMMHEFFFLAASGYVVFFCNPRGSQGYGEANSKSIYNNWGDVAFSDLMKWTDHVARKPYIDSNKIGVTGGSYGGYMTGWIVGHTNRFKAAVAQRMVSNLISMWGSSDMNWVFQQEFGKKPPYENLQNMWKQSPIAYAGNVKTPTLIIHSEQDHRCEIEQGEQFYVALKTQGIDTELVRFPNEPHGLSRAGRTDRRIVRLNHIKRWFDKYLK